MTAVDLAVRLQPDVVLMDVAMPRGGGLGATREIAAALPDLAIVMLTASEDIDDLFEAIKAGARGYLLKNLEAPELRGMLEAVARGEAAITPAIAARMLTELARPPGATARAAGPGPATRTVSPTASWTCSAWSSPDAGTRRSAAELGISREHRQVPPAQHPRQAPRAEPCGDGRHGGPRGAPPRRLTVRARRERAAPARCATRAHASRHALR